MLAAKQIDKINKIASFSGISFAEAKKFYLESIAELNKSDAPAPTVVAGTKLQRRLDNEALGMRVIRFAVKPHPSGWGYKAVTRYLSLKNC